MTENEDIAHRIVTSGGSILSPFRPQDGFDKTLVTFKRSNLYELILDALRRKDETKDR